MGFTSAEAAATLDVRFATGASTDYIAWSADGSNETASLARTSVGSWAAATVADPSVKANSAIITTAAATGSVTVSHGRIMTASSGGTARTDWEPLRVGGTPTPRALLTGDALTIAIGAHQITLT